MARHTGRCHCGALSVVYETDKPLAPRACQCRFCRKHHARSVSDPDGSATITLGPGAVRYRFGRGLGDFLVCGQCGVYLGAVQKIDGRLYTVLNLTAFEDPHEGLAGEPMDYDGETAEQRTARRRARWTPATMVER
ncbi:MAG TPA: hypothetical protein VEB68_08575 [Croceibacterium sp.]|nr:hypothetical protein [Croceibacterium sp.]